MRRKDGNFLVTVDFGKGPDVDFNIVSSVFGKGDDGIANWLREGYDTYVNKEKALNYLHLSAPIAEAISSPRPVSEGKVSENPGTGKGNGENSSDVRFSTQEGVVSISKCNVTKNFCKSTRARRTRCRYQEVGATLHEREYLIITTSVRGKFQGLPKVLSMRGRNISIFSLSNIHILTIKYGYFHYQIWIFSLSDIHILTANL